MLALGRHVSSGALLRFASAHINTVMNEWLHCHIIFFLLLGPFPTRTRCYHRSRFYDQNSGNQRAEGQGTWRLPSRDIARRCTVDFPVANCKYDVLPAADMGHSWPGEVSLHYSELLPQCQRPHSNLRHYLRGLLQVPSGVAEGDWAVCQQPSGDYISR